MNHKKLVKLAKKINQLRGKTVAKMGVYEYAKDIKFYCSDLSHVSIKTKKKYKNDDNYCINLHSQIKCPFTVERIDVYDNYRTKVEVCIDQPRMKVIEPSQYQVCIMLTGSNGNNLTVYLNHPPEQKKLGFKVKVKNNAPTN